MKQVKQKVLGYLARSGKVVSGESMAMELGVTRAAVWKAIRELKKEGEDIRSSRKGYFLIPKEEIRPSTIMAKLPFVEQVECYPTITSTNDRAKELAVAGAPHFTCVVAEEQSQGRGRFSRTFYSQKGTGLYLSVILRPHCNATYVQRITTCAAVAISDAIEELTGCDVGIKWVNDLWMGGKKICGILTEGAITPDGGLEYGVLGIGINVRATQFPEEISHIATDIETQTGVALSLLDVLLTLMKHLATRLTQLESGEYLADYRRRSVLDGKQVTLSRGGETIYGTVLGIGEDGELLLLTETGNISISSGEVVTSHLDE